jgi:hypothetical protein
MLNTSGCAFSISSSNTTEYGLRHVPRRRPDEPAHAELLHVLRHVDADERLLVREQEAREGPGQLGLADARGAAEDERADWPARILEAGAGAADRAGDGVDGLVLAHHRLVHLLLHAEQPLGFRLLQPRDRDAGPARDDERDLLLLDGRAVLLPFLLPLLLPLADLALQLALLVAQRCRTLEVLVADGLFLVPVDCLELLLEVGDLRRWHLRGEPGPRGRLVDHVDRLVRQEPVGDVALRQLGRRVQRLVGDDHLVVVLVALPQAL